MPWGTWLTCEETEIPGHGYVFEVDPLRSVSRRLPALGRFVHEAVAFDPRSEILYLTEDQDGAPLYRFRPARRGSGRFEAGSLEALAIRESPARYEERRPYEVTWVKISDTDPEPDDKSTRVQGQARGAVRFARCEGICYGGGSIYFTATTGGPAKLGQVWRLTPSPQGDILELWAESRRKEDMEAPDNITFSGSGDLYLCEDGAGNDRLVGITPAGHYFGLASVRVSEAETAGVTFGPDGRSLYFNIQGEGLTLVVTGPFRGAASPGERSLSHRLPPRQLEPAVPAEYCLAALDRGYGPLEAAALHRLGVPLL
jgi:secreted PhoX family phosphatase